MRLLPKILSLFLFLTLHVSAQEVKSHKFVPYLQSLNTYRLSKRLTSGIQSDEEKVAAIHSWITHNIEFDVGKWLSCDYSHTPLKKILIRRKAVSSGYADLFNELCRYADIPTMVVNGYPKSEYSDLRDPFYVDEHDWNAAYVNNQWLLTDACWDAGFIQYYRRTFAGVFIYAFTFGTSDRLVYRPHFVSAPSNHYLNKPGNYFITNHIPANPAWQIISPVVPVETAEQDSSFYYQQFDTTTVQYPNDEFEAVRNKLATLKEDELAIANGFSSFEYNPKNNYHIANSYLLKATYLFSQVNPLSTDKAPMILKCDTVSTYINLSNQHCDSNAVLLLKQKNELTANNLKKKNTMLEQNKKLIASTENCLKNFNAGMKIAISGKIQIKTVHQRNKIMVIKMKRNDKFEKTQYGRKVNVADSISSAQQIITLTAKQLQMDSDLRKKFADLDQLHSSYLSNIEEYAKRSAENTKTLRKIWSLRLKFVDDLDHTLRHIKDSLISHKYQDDSLLISGSSGPTVTYFYRQFNSLKDDFKNLYDINEDLLIEYAKFKKANKQKNDITPAYENSIKLYVEEMKDYASLLKSFKKKFKQIYKASKGQIETVHAENHGYTKEKYIELQMFATRNAYISRHYKSRLNENKNIKSENSKLLRKLEKARKKLEEKK